ncbi:ROK family protein [Candidatus Falkowbacteria bacterium]|nr:ROK family protein [Candidatus Falkowbacteria bacterium]
MAKIKKYTIGVDIGGTNMKAVLFNGEKTVMNYSLGTPKDTISHMLIMIKALIDPLLEKAEADKVRVSGIGLSVAGAHDFNHHKIAKSPNLPLLDGVKLAEQVHKTMKMPVKMDNDANCFVRAESLIGAAKKFNNVYGIIISTGIGGGWWLNKKIYRGAHGGAGEPGGMVMDFTDTIKLEEAYQRLNQNNSLNMATEAYRGDVLAQRSYEEIGRLLGTACANIVNMVDPEAIVIGGGTVKSSDLFFPEMKKEMTKYIMSPIAASKVKLLKGKLGNDAGAIGAALLVN